MHFRIGSFVRREPVSIPKEKKLSFSKTMAMKLQNFTFETDDRKTVLEKNPVIRKTMIPVVL